MREKIKMDIRRIKRRELDEEGKEEEEEWERSEVKVHKVDKSQRKERKDNQKIPANAKMREYEGKAARSTGNELGAGSGTKPLFR